MRTKIVMLSLLGAITLILFSCQKELIKKENGDSVAAGNKLNFYETFIVFTVFANSNFIPGSGKSEDGSHYS